MDKLEEETLAKDQVIKIKNICYRLGRNKDPDIGALLAVSAVSASAASTSPLEIPNCSSIASYWLDLVGP